MKPKINIELILLLFFLLSEVLVILGVPFGSSALLVGGLFWAFGYIIFSGKIFNRKNSEIEQTMRVMAGPMLFLVPLGILFRLKFWAGGQLFLFLGLMTSMILLIIVLSIAAKKQNGFKIYFPILRSSLILFAVGLCFFIISARPLIKLQYLSAPEQGRAHLEYLVSIDELSSEK